MPQDNGWTPVEPASTKSPAGWTPVETTSTGISAPQGVAPSVNEGNSVLGGVKRRFKSTLQGIGDLVSPTKQSGEENVPEFFLPGYRIGKGVISGEKEAARQTVQQAKDAIQGFKSDPVAAGLKGAQAITTGLSMLNPFATGAVTNINKIDASGRTKEAIGQGAFDAIILLAGRKMGEEPSAIDKVNKLSYATEAAPKDLAHVLPEFEETAGRLGKAQTVGDFVDHIQKTLTRLDQKFNSALFRNADRQVIPQDLANELRARAAEMPPSVDGQAMAKQLNKAAVQYEKPWTLRQLNAERMMRSGYLKGFYGKSGSAQMAATRSSVDTIIDKIVADGARDTLYNELDRLNPGQDFRALKNTQSKLIDIKDAADAHLDALEKAQAKFKGAPLSEKAEISASVHTGGMTPRLHGLKRMLPGGGPLVNADNAVRSAAGASAWAKVARAAILNLPVSTLVTGQTTSLPPPPKYTDQ